MSKRDWSLVAIVIVVSACAFITGIAIHPILHFYFDGIGDAYSYQAPISNTEGWSGFPWTPSVVSSLVVAIFTYLLWRVSRQQKILLEQAQRTADKGLGISIEAYQLAIDGLAETKKSVSAYIESERGVIRMRDCILMTDQNNTSQIFLTLENVGSGIATLERVEVGYQVMKNVLGHPSEDNKFTTVSDLRHLMRPGEVATLGGSYREGDLSRTMNLVGFDPDVPTEVGELYNGSENALAASYRITYYTPYKLRYEVTEIVVIDAEGYHFMPNPIDDRNIAMD